MRSDSSESHCQGHLNEKVKIVFRTYFRQSGSICVKCSAAHS